LCLRRSSWLFLPSAFFPPLSQWSTVIIAWSERETPNAGNMSLSDLPALNAALNTASFFLLSFGYQFIRSKKIAAHRACMVSAMITSTLFLISYLVYHFNYPTTRFTGTGIARPIYFTILFSHVTLAIVIVPLVI